MPYINSLRRLKKVEEKANQHIGHQVLLVDSVVIDTGIKYASEPFYDSIVSMHQIKTTWSLGILEQKVEIIIPESEKSKKKWNSFESRRYQVKFPMSRYVQKDGFFQEWAVHLGDLNLYGEGLFNLNRDVSEHDPEYTQATKLFLGEDVEKYFATRDPTYAEALKILDAGISEEPEHLAQ